MKTIILAVAALGMLTQPLAAQKRLSADEKTHDGLQASFDKWYPRTMNIFGRKGSPKNALYRKYGLKKARKRPQFSKR